ncbi:hypothetical protein AB0E69_18440 [Kribbella sp. NPDC026611]|uniref:hypothetical protein n=1 Tax=Kribbella sp. NPDC026611 TaxID=3154911 RepID=UPI00340EDE8C
MPVKRRRWRAFLAGFLVLLGGVVLTPPVRATVAEWLRIGGVEAQQVPTGPSTAPPVPTISGRLSLDQAAQTAGFTPVHPAVLGEPTGVQASKGFVAMSWPGVRLEQFQSDIQPMYLKQYYEDLEYVDAVNGYWFKTPHNLVLVDKRVVRIAAPTLVWVRDGITYRLEGVNKARAVELAEGTN